MARASKALARWRTKLARDPEAHADEDPIEPVRRAAGKSTWDALTGLTPPAAEAPLRDALVPWVGVLTLARLGREDDVAWARAAADERGAFRGRSAAARELARGVARRRDRADDGGRDALARGGGDVGEELASLAPRARREARRGRAPPRARAPLGAAPARGRRRRPRAAARRLPRRDGGPGARDVEGRARRRRRRGGGAARRPRSRSGRGWPAHLTRRWLEEAFAGALAGLTLELPPLPAALGAASFAAGSRGSRLRGAPRGGAGGDALRARPRAGLARGASPRLRASRPCRRTPEWQVRALGLGRRVAMRQARVLARTALLDARLRRGAHPARGRGRPHAAGPLCRARRAPLRRARSTRASAARGPPHATTSRRASSRSPRRGAFTDDLRDRFDADWFRNPRAWAHVRAVSAVPAGRAARAPRRSTRKWIAWPARSRERSDESASPSRCSRSRWARGGHGARQASAVPSARPRSRRRAPHVPVRPRATLRRMFPTRRARAASRLPAIASSSSKR